MDASGEVSGFVQPLQAPGKPMVVLSPMSSHDHIVLRADGAQFVWLHTGGGRGVWLFMRRRRERNYAATRIPR